MKTLRTSPPAAYLTPTVEEMKAVAKRLNLGAFSPALVADLANIAAGGRILPPTAYASHVELEAKMAHLGATHERDELVRSETQRRMAYHQAVATFLQGVDMTSTPGDTPLEKAIATVALLSENVRGGTPSGDGDDPAIPVFAKDSEAAKAASTVNETVAFAESLTEEEKEKAEVDSLSTQDALQDCKIASEFAPGKAKRALIELGRKLKKLAKFATRKAKLVKPDPAGTSQRIRPINGLGEFHLVGSQDLALYTEVETLFLHRAITQQLLVKERVNRIDQKQLLYILMDASGSMDQDNRHQKAAAVVLNRLEAVRAGDAEVFIVPFAEGIVVSREMHAHDTETADTVEKQYRRGNYHGGGTDIAKAMKQAIARMQELKTKDPEYFVYPELVVITDDDASMRLTTADMQGIRVHGFAMGTRNEALMQLAIATGGVALQEL